MLRLLHEVIGPGYPDDYLLSRLHGQRAAPGMGGGEAPAITSTTGSGDSLIWERAATARSWLFQQLGTELRIALAPLFVYFELGQIVQALRYLAGDRPQAADHLLQTSMLAPAIRTILRDRVEVTEVLARMERFFAGTPLSLAGIKESFSHGGLQPCEALLRNRFLTQILASGLQRDLVFFFQAVIDLRNILTVAKSLRWRPHPAPVMIPGGQVAAPGSVQQVTMENLARMVRRWTHGLLLAGEELQPQRLEPILHAHLLHKLIRRRRQGGPAAACIEYVWCCFVAARERSWQLHTGGVAMYGSGARGLWS